MAEMMTNLQESKNLDELVNLGYTRIPKAFDAASVKWMLDRVIELKRTSPPPVNLPYLDRDPDFQIIYNLCLKDAKFLRLILNQPQIMALLKARLNDPWFKSIPSEDPNFILRSLNARSSGVAPMSIHIDSFVPSPGSFTWSMQLAVVLEEHTPENGATLLVPRSHLNDRYASPADLDQAIPSLAQPGDAVLWDSRIWHATLGNTSGKTRWSLIAGFVRWWVKQAFDITGSLPKEIYDQCTPQELAVLGFCSRPPEDETQSVDMKTGYENLAFNKSH